MLMVTGSLELVCVGTVITIEFAAENSSNCTPALANGDVLTWPGVS